MQKFQTLSLWNCGTLIPSMSGSTLAAWAGQWTAAWWGAGRTPESAFGSHGAEILIRILLCLPAFWGERLYATCRSRCCESTFFLFHSPKSSAMGLWLRNADSNRGWFVWVGLEMALDLCRMLVQPHCRVLTCPETHRSKVQKVRLAYVQLWTTKPIPQIQYILSYCKDTQISTQQKNLSNKNPRCFCFRENYSSCFLLANGWFWGRLGWCCLHASHHEWLPSLLLGQVQWVSRWELCVWRVGLIFWMKCSDRVGKCWSSILHRKSWHEQQLLVV